MPTPTDRTYTSREVALIVGIESPTYAAQMNRIARSCGIDSRPGSGHHAHWTYHDVISLAVTLALAPENRTAHLTTTSSHLPYRDVSPYGRAVADTCARGVCPAYLIINGDDWLLIDDSPTADHDATDIVLRAARNTGTAIRVLHLRPIYTRIDQLDR